MAQALSGAAMLLLLMSVVARAFLAETPFHLPQATVEAPAAEAPDPGAKDEVNLPIDRGELARVSFVVLLLAAAAVWLVSLAISPQAAVRHRFLAVLIAAFAVLCYGSALIASDKRAAYNAWLEQASLLLAAFLAAQLFRERKRFVLLLVVLAAVGGTLAVKAFGQYFFEIPERVHQFAMYRGEHLQIVGLSAGSPQAKAFENRVRDTAVTGFWSLANLFGSLMIVLMTAGVGLAADKLLEARRGFAAWKAAALRGELHTPTLAAILSAVLAAAMVPALLMTRSRGGIVAGLAALLAAGLVWRFREALARKWKKNLVRLGVIVLLLGAAVVAYGLKYDRLPSKTLTFRWYYWTASAEIIREHPMGVGPGNFPNAYLAHRRPAAEEAVKMPHNFVLQALAEYGWPGGLCFVGAIVYVLAGLCRPRGKSVHELHEGEGDAKGFTSGDNSLRGIRGIRGQSCFNPLILAPVLAAMPIARVLFAGSAADVGLVIYDVALPTAVLAAMLLAFGWFGRRYLCGLGLDDRLGRIALGCGLFGFVLHNLIEFGLFMPGAAMAFWVAAGACLARAGPDQPPRDLSRVDLWRQTHLPRWGVVLGIGAVAAAAWFFWMPVYRRTVLTQETVDAIRAGRLRQAADLALQTLKADDLDPYSASEASRVLMGISPASAHQWAKVASERDGANPNLQRQWAEAAMYSAWPDAWQYAWLGLPPDAAKALRDALSLEPRNVALLSRLAGVLFVQGKGPESIAMLEKACTLEPDSPMLRVRMGDAYWRMGKGPEACEAWKKAADLTRHGDADAYLSPMGKAAELDPQNARLHLAYAQMLLWAGEPEFAKAELGRAESLNEQLNAESIERLKPAEVNQLQTLRARAQCLRD